MRSTGSNSSYKKLAVCWLNEALYFVSSTMRGDRLVLRNRELLVAVNRYVLRYESPCVDELSDI